MDAEAKAMFVEVATDKLRTSRDRSERVLCTLLITVDQGRPLLDRIPTPHVSAELLQDACLVQWHLRAI